MSTAVLTEPDLEYPAVPIALDVSIQCEEGAVAPVPFKLTVGQYHRMIETAILGENDRVELLNGLLIAMSPIGPTHCYIAHKLYEALRSIVPGTRYCVYSQRPATLPDSEPEPDLLIVRGAADDFADRHPGPGDVLVIVEVSDSSLAFDQRIKAPIYAATSLPEYWIVNVPGRQVEVYRDPVRNEADGSISYGNQVVYREGSLLPVVVDGQNFGNLSVGELFQTKPRS